MDERVRSIVTDLRSKSSSEAADWLMKHYPVGSTGAGEAITIVQHLSWKKSDQTRLAEYYLSGIPFASARPYEVFASFMQTRRLVDIMRKHIPNNDRKQLLEYHAGPVLTRAAKTPEDHEAVQSFLAEVRRDQYSG
ncbi:hypothetical protein V5279_11710 [Bradyrhizobium sp. 26S5]|uniref:hypothetical protein n=1 Tax=Bradyrhizobium sp. 26S5 TaxID=3139729 RepID=UPI0030D33B60